MVGIGDEVIVNGYRGVVRFAGSTQFADGIWYGIELEECVGRNDGSVENKKYFDLEKEGLYGIFARLPSLALINDKDKKDEGQQSLVLQENERLIDENAQLRQQLEDLNSEGPSDVIEFLTIQNTDLSKSMEILRNEVFDLKQKEETHIKLQGVYMEVEKELREQLEEFQLLYNENIDSLKNENAKLMQGLADKIDPHTALMDLRSQLKIMEQEVYENKFLRCFYELSANKETEKAWFQFNYLFERIMDDRIRNSFPTKQKCRFLLLVLSEISKVVEGTAVQDLFQKAVGDASAWTAPFLEGFIPDSRIEPASIFNFLEANPVLDHNCLLVVRCFEIACGSIIPDLLAFHLENSSSESDVELISEIYSCCLSIQKKCQELMRNDSDGKNLISSEEFSAQNLFHSLFEKLICQFEGPFDVCRFLDLLGDIFDEVKGIEPQEHVEDIESLDVNILNRKAEESETLDSDAAPSAISHLETLLHDKEAFINELLVKNQILRQRVTDWEGQEKLLNTLRTKLDHTEKENSHLLKSVFNFENLVGALQATLKREEVKAYQIVPNERFSSLASELVTTEKLDLISEIRDLRQIVAGYVDKTTSVQEDMYWLKQSAPRASWFIDVPFSNKIHNLTNDVLDFVSYSTSVNLEEKNFKKNYLSNATFKKTVIEIGIRDVVKEE